MTDYIKGGERETILGVGLLRILRLDEQLGMVEADMSGKLHSKNGLFRYFGHHHHWDHHHRVYTVA